MSGPTVTPSPSRLVNLPRRLRAARPTVAAALLAAGLLTGCGAASSASAPAPNSTTPSSTTQSSSQFNPALVPAPQTTTTTTTTRPARTAKRTAPKKAPVKHPVPAGASHQRPATPSDPPSASAISVAAPPSAGPPAAPGGGSNPVTITRTITVTRTIPVMPNVPSGAHVPSPAPALYLTHFAAAGGDIGCALGGGVARCDIANRVWSPPKQPSSCGLAWAQGLQVGPSGPAHFVCAGDSTLDPTGSRVPAGRDVTVGSVTCQVRTFGVTCFDAGGSGFFISRTGYDTF